MFLYLRAEPMPHRDNDNRLHEHLLAVVVASTVLLLAGTLMWQTPAGSGLGLPPAPAQLRWLAFASPPRLPPESPSPSSPLRVSGRPASAPPAPMAAPVVAAPSHRAAPPAPALYDQQGRPRLAIVARAGLDQRSQAERLFDRADDPLAVRRDGALFDTPRAGTAQSRSQRLIYGTDIQAARARPPPPVRYNPALHERRSDLPSVQGPDAYRLAAIADEPPPGLEGQASAVLLPRQAALAGAARCAAPAMDDARAALSSHLMLLQQAEQRYRQGSSPIEREHSLQAEIGRQYNLARRALWQVERLLGQCPMS